MRPLEVELDVPPFCKEAAVEDVEDAAAEDAEDAAVAAAAVVGSSCDVTTTVTGESDDEPPFG